MVSHATRCVAQNQKRVEPFRMARHDMISANPESDVNDYMEKWAIKQWA